MSRIFQVLQGDSAAGCFLQALQPKAEDLLVNLDFLQCGPLQPFRTAEQWTQLRGAYWDSIAPAEYPPTQFNCDFVSTMLSLGDADSLVFWVGMGIAEQLLLAWSASLLKMTGSRAKVSVVQFIRIRKNGMPVWALGVLNPDQIADHAPVTPLSADELDELAAYWAAATSSDPTQLLSVVSNDTTRFPHLRAGLQQILSRYPDHETGLGRWDYELLKYTKETGPQAARIIGETMVNNFDYELMGDDYLLWRLRRLGVADVLHPLVALSGDPNSIRDCEVRLTDTGERVLNGDANAIALNGIDDWVLGVHLTSATGGVWYRKGNALVLKA